jgi:hypothetical protein
MHRNRPHIAVVGARFAGHVWLRTVKEQQVRLQGGASGAIVQREQHMWFNWNTM